MEPGDAHRERGFTILELLVAMSIFMVLATLLYGMVGNAMSLWMRGEERREIYEFGQAVLSRISADLRTVHTGGIPLFANPDVRLLGDFDASQRSRIRFVRSISASDRALMYRAGTTSKPTKYLDLDGDAAELAEGTLKPHGGTMEVCYAVIPESEFDAIMKSFEEVSVVDPSSDPGASQSPAKRRAPSSSLVLLRGIRAPIGGPRSLLQRDDLDDPIELVQVTRPLAYGVLYFGLEYAGHGVGDLSFEAEQGEVVWDSTRGILPQFGLALGPQSESDVRDDVFPRAIRVTLVLERPGERSRSTRLNRPLSATDRRLTVANPSLLPTSGDVFRFVKVGHEWLEIGDAVGREFLIVRRGLRGTSASAHPSRTEIHVGVTFRKVVAISSYRESVVK